MSAEPLHVWEPEVAPDGPYEGEVSSDPTMPWQRWTWVLPDSAHGTLVEVARPYIAVDGKWDSANAADRA